MAAFAFALATSGALRVASLDLCADEYLLMFARDDQIAAVSRLSQDPAESRYWQRARRFPAYGGRAEALLPVRPNLLLSVGSPGGKSTMTFARRLGWKTLTLPYAQTPQQVGRNVMAVAEMLGVREKGQRWLAALRRLQRSPPAPVDALFLTAGGFSVDPGSVSAQWMRLAGYRQLPVQGVRITLERLALNPPPALLLSDYRSGQMSLGQRWLDHPLVRNARSKRVHTDGRPWTCAGPAMLDEVQRLRGGR